MDESCHPDTADATQCLFSIDYLTMSCSGEAWHCGNCQIPAQKLSRGPINQGLCEILGTCGTNLM